MGWISFLLGRPGFEYTFDINPEAMTIEEQGIAVTQRNLAGDMKKSYLRTSAPNIKINSSWLQFPQRNQFASLAGITDSFLSFQTRDDWQMNLEYDIPTDLNTVIIENTSATRLSSILAALGLTSIITIQGVFTIPDGSGTNYFTGGAYADATRRITLGSPLPSSVQPVYVNYLYTGWLVHMPKFQHAYKGGRLDLGQYDVTLEAA